MGASVGHFLAKRGFGKVVLLEKRTLAAVSTGHSAANVRTYYSNPVTVKLSWRAVQMFENDREALGGDSGFQQVGFLILLDEDSLAPGQQVFEMQQANGVDVRQISPQDVGGLAPSLDLAGIVKATFEPRGGYADPARTTRSLAESAVPWGLSVHEGVGATGIRLGDGRVTGVETEEGLIDTPVVVNAAGPWGRQVGLWVGRNYSVRWSREADLVLAAPPDLGPLPVVSDPPQRLYFHTHGDDLVLAGLGFPKEVEPLDIDGYDSGLEPETRQRIERPLAKRVPQLSQARYVSGWSSIYTITDDWHPLVGPEPGLEGYYAFFAGSGHSFKLGPPLGEALAAIIAGDTPEIDISGLRPSRFAEGETFSSAWGSGNRG